MQRFRLKQWRETYEEVIIEAENLAEAEQMADDYPDYIGCAAEVVKEVESKLKTEVEAIETTSWLVHFDDYHNDFLAESEQFETDKDINSAENAKAKAIEWLGKINESPYHYVWDIPEVVGDWEASRAGGTDTLILWRNLSNKATLTLVEIWQPKR